MNGSWKLGYQTHELLSFFIFMCHKHESEYANVNVSAKKTKNKINIKIIQVIYKRCATTISVQNVINVIMLRRSQIKYKMKGKWAPGVVFYDQ